MSPLLRESRRDRPSPPTGGAAPPQPAPPAEVCSNPAPPASHPMVRGLPSGWSRLHLPSAQWAARDVPAVSTSFSSRVSPASFPSKPMAVAAPASQPIAACSSLTLPVPPPQRRWLATMDVEVQQVSAAAGRPPAPRLSANVGLRRGGWGRRAAGGGGGAWGGRASGQTGPI